MNYKYLRKNIFTYTVHSAYLDVSIHLKLIISVVDVCNKEAVYITEIFDVNSSK